jgi:hypothetical protein
MRVTPGWRLATVARSMRCQSALCALLIVLAALAVDHGAHAQVNLEPMRQRIKRQGASLVVQWTLDGRTGNTQGVTADGLVGGGLASGRHLAFAFASVDYTRLNKTLGVDKSFAHVRYNYEIAPSVHWEVFAQAQSDLFQRIEFRSLVGTGPRYALYDDPTFRLALGLAYMFERDVINVEPGAPDARLQFAHRASSYLTAHATLSDGIDAVTTTYAQPKIDDPRDIRILNESGFIFKVAKALSTSISFTAHFDSRPPTGVVPTDAEVKNIIALQL